MSNRTRASIVDNDAILQRLDHEHLAALERFTTLSEADVDAEVDERPETKTACRAFDAIGFTAAAFPATSLEGLKLKTRILARQGRALTAGEMLFKEGEILQRLGVSVLADALSALQRRLRRGARLRGGVWKTHDGTARARGCELPRPACFSSDKVLIMPALEKLSSIASPPVISKDAPLRLADAAILAFPLGGITASGLRKEANRGNSAVERIAGKDYTTLAAIETMREKCRSNQRARRLYLKKDDAAAVWIIRDGAKRISTRCGPLDRGEAERALARYLAAKYEPPKERHRDPAAVWGADVISVYAADVGPNVRRPARAATASHGASRLFRKETTVRYRAGGMPGLRGVARLRFDGSPRIGRLPGGDPPLSQARLSRSNHRHDAAGQIRVTRKMANPRRSRSAQFAPRGAIVRFKRASKRSATAGATWPASFLWASTPGRAPAPSVGPR